MRTEKMVLNQERNVTLTAYLLEVEGEFGYVSRRPAILVLPGGGYRHCSDREADPVAMPYLHSAVFREGIRCVAQSAGGL